MSINIELTRSEAELLKKIMGAVLQQKGYLVVLKDCNGEYLFSSNEAGLPFDDLVRGIIERINFRELQEFQTWMQGELHEASKREDFMQEIKND